MKHNMPYALADEVEEIYQWSIDFFGIQEGDRFAVIYDEKFTDTTSVGIGRIYGASFTSGNKTIYAIPYVNENGRIAYWDADGASLKKQMLKAPLKYTRISSKFTHKRLHPVHRVYRPHLGVDYAAPSGTPVHSVADGTVIKAGWGGGGGNTIYIKHSGGLQTGYLHLKSFAKGIKVGSKVSQGQLIGYVGSTGTSTGPHLDYRIWQNGTPIDPLKVTQQPQEPIAKKYFSDFERVRDLVISELQGKGSETSRVTEDDIFRRPKSDSTQNN
ncbi:MAG: peptidoglycan DD-metalloendopeptidase family protein, partial [Alistipes sp.]|nr:peptidoglycan DD-metalloendopeptidase family protein [Alistipes sp.]